MSGEYERRPWLGLYPSWLQELVLDLETAVVGVPDANRGEILRRDPRARTTEGRTERRETGGTGS